MGVARFMGPQGAIKDVADFNAGELDDDFWGSDEPSALSSLVGMAKHAVGKQAPPAAAHDDDDEKKAPALMVDEEDVDFDAIEFSPAPVKSAKKAPNEEKVQRVIADENPFGDDDDADNEGAGIRAALGVEMLVQGGVERLVVLMKTTTISRKEIH